MIARVFRWIGSHPALFLSLPAIYLLLFYPPLWKDVDAVNQLLEPASVINIYHFPALYCFLARIPLWVGDLFQRPHWPALLGQQEPTLTGIYALVVAQQCALVASLRLLAQSAGRESIGRGLVTILLCLASGLYAQAQTCGSEAWGMIALILVYTFGLRLAAKPTLLGWTGYTGALLLTVGSRHINLILGAWLVTLFLVTALYHAATRMSAQMRISLRLVGLAVMAWALALFLNAAFAHLVAQAAHVEPRTTLGRTLSDRVKTFLDACTPGERKLIAERVAAKVSDPMIKEAIMDQAVIGSFYDGTGKSVAQRLIAKGYNGEDLGVRTDRVILQVSLAYYRSFHPKLLGVIWRDFAKGILKGNNAGLAEAPFEHNRYVAENRGTNPTFWRPLDVLPSTFLPAAVLWQKRALHDFYLDIGNHWRLGILLLGCVGAAVALTRCRSAALRVMIPVSSTLVSGLVVFGATMACVYYMDRYTIPLEISILVSLAIIAGELGAAINSLRGNTAQPPEKAFVHPG
jgi:hypothetical protein